jgi:hypothetical protein
MEHTTARSDRYLALTSLAASPCIPTGVRLGNTGTVQQVASHVGNAANA